MAEGLAKYFEQFGQVEEAIVMLDPSTGRSRGFGFVSFTDPASIDQVLQTKNHILGGRSIDPKRAVPRDQPQRSSSGPSRSFVAGLPLSATDADITAVLSPFGAITDAAVVKDRSTGESRGFAFVTFESGATLDVVMEASKAGRLFVQGKQIEVREAMPKGSAPDSHGDRGSRGGPRGGFRDRPRDVGYRGPGGDRGGREYDRRGSRDGGRDGGYYGRGGYGGGRDDRERDRGGYGGGGWDERGGYDRDRGRGGYERERGYGGYERDRGGYGGRGGGGGPGAGRDFGRDGPGGAYGRDNRSFDRGGYDGYRNDGYAAAYGGGGGGGGNVPGGYGAGGPGGYYSGMMGMRRWSRWARRAGRRVQRAGAVWRDGGRRHGRLCRRAGPGRGRGRGRGRGPLAGRGAGAGAGVAATERARRTERVECSRRSWRDGAGRGVGVGVCVCVYAGVCSGRAARGRSRRHGAAGMGGSMGGSRYQPY
ncbi:hypothetical protein BC831DRAFT_209093 [Entophlyctis helioformis]|nr:hypothetical protein BC831DRAFT_209093 [Entophlyctis helioformis]